MKCQKMPSMTPDVAAGALLLLEKAILKVSFDMTPAPLPFPPS